MRNLKIETNLFYDERLTGIYFDENFKYISEHVFLYTDFGNLSNDFDKYNFFEIVETNKRKLNRLKIDLIDNNYIKNVSLDDAISNFLYCNDLSDLSDLLRYYDIEYNYNYEVINLRGYSQGDYITIYINKREYKDTTGGDVYNINENYLFNLCYDMLIFGEIIISFDYTTKGGINHNYKKTFDFYEITKNEYSIDLDINFKDIKLIQYKLNEDEKNEILNELQKIDYTDIRI